jgi:hypothetical protein
VDEVMTPEQWAKAVDRLEQELGLEDQPRAVVFHLKEGRAHVHVVWSRIELERMTAISDSHNFRRHEIVARELEREFGHARVQGAHVERDGQPRPDRTPSHAEMQQAERNCVTPEQATAELTALWQRTDSGKTFVAALGEEGWSLARGDRRDYVAVDPQGGIHSLSRRIEGARAKDIRARMADVDAALLPTTAEAKEIQRARQQPRAERGSAPQERPAPSSPQPSPRDAAFDTGEQAHKTGQKSRTAAACAFTDVGKEAPQDARQESREEDSRKQPPAKNGLNVLNAATGVVSKLGDFMVDLLAGGSPTPARSTDMGAFVSDPAARKEQQLARLAERQQARVSEKALERMHNDLQAGKALSSSDIQNLTRAQQESIKAYGDDAVWEMVEEARKRAEQHWRGDGRERD